MRYSGHQIAALAVQQRLPTVALLRDFAEAGCLIGHGPNLQLLARRAPMYVDELLKGATPRRVVTRLVGRHPGPPLDVLSARCQSALY
jgi:hypothetical protein